MVEMKNPVKEADAHPEIGHLSLWRTDLAYYWVINCEPGLQDDMHYHDNDDHIFMCLEGECTVRTPHKAFVLKQFDTVLLNPASLINCAIPARAECFSGAGNSHVDGKPRTRVPKIPATRRSKNRSSLLRNRVTPRIGSDPPLNTAKRQLSPKKPAAQNTLHCRL